jgi:hypothetical protein
VLWHLSDWYLVFSLVSNMRNLSLLLQSSPMFIQDLKERFDKRNKVLEKLGVARQPRETLVFTKKMKAQYTKLYGDSVELWGYRLSASRHSNPDNRIEISVAPNFEMYTEFKAWNKNWLADSTDATCLFCEIHEENAGKFLQPWNVKFKGQYMFVLQILISTVPLRCVNQTIFRFCIRCTQRQHM